MSNLSVFSKNPLMSVKNIINVPRKLMPISSINEINIDIAAKRKKNVTTFFSKIDKDLRNIFFLFNNYIKLIYRFYFVQLVK